MWAEPGRLASLAPTWADSMQNPHDAAVDRSASTDLPELVDKILEINPTANGNYLSGFGRDALSHYLDHLQTSTGPRGRQAAGWVRRAETPGIVGRRARESRG